MAYCALARTWRPQSFTEYVGQTHAVSALQQALRQEKLHHAYLFTGTRGVGKTTIARLFAKSLSCIEGIQAEPCGRCKHCKAISSGRYLDLIEIDAASRTKVEDTRELLSQVNYPPAQGRFKIYLIDEVHMLSSHSFNALLKTLEEPPQHVKFLLATTDPQKLPITIQSRCLQFHLQHLDADQITKQLAHIVRDQKMEYHEAGLALIAQHAHGSMRDAITLLEQTLAACSGTLDEASVSSMLGTLPSNILYQLMYAISASDKPTIAELLKKLDTQSYDYFAVINQMLSLLCQVSQIQLLLNKTASDPDKDSPSGLALALDSERTQIMLALLLEAKQTLDHYPDHSMGFTTLVLRLLCFTPEQDALHRLLGTSIPDATVAAPSSPLAVQAQASISRPAHQSAQAILQSRQPNSCSGATPQLSQASTLAPTKRSSATASTETQSPTPSANTRVPSSEKFNSQPQSFSNWAAVVQALPLGGLQQQALAQCTLNNPVTENTWTILVPKQYQLMLQAKAQQTISITICRILQRDIRILFQEAPAKPSPAASAPLAGSTSTTPVSAEPTPSPSIDIDNNPKLASLLEALDATAQPVS